MKSSLAVLLLSLFLSPVPHSLAQQSPDAKQAEFIAYAHFKALTPAEQNELLSKAQSEDAEAQYWMGVLYEEGTVPKNLEQGRRWLLKSAEQGYAPAQRAYGLMTALSDSHVGNGGWCGRRSKTTRKLSFGSLSPMNRTGLEPPM